MTTFLFVDDATSPCSSWATSFDESVASTVASLPELSGDGLIMLYA